jgi:hypothetical protein
MAYRLNIAALLFSAFFLTSCDFVDSKGAELHDISLPSYLTNYFSGDTIEYNGIIERGLQSQQGVKLNASMKITFNTAAVVADPFSAETHNFTRVTTVQTIAEEEIATVQYITQTPADDSHGGSIFIHAFDAVDPTKKLWITTDDEYSVLKSIQTLWSPFEDPDQNINEIGQNRSINYQIMGDCDQTQCKKLADYTENFHIIEKVSGDQAIQTTYLGDFEAYKIRYDGQIFPVEPLGKIIDIRAACGGINSTDTITFGGYAYIYPQIGVLRIENNICSSQDIQETSNFDISTTTLDFN